MNIPLLFFQLNNYPTTIATKKCSVNVDYVKWYNDFIIKLDDAVEKYNGFLEFTSKGTEFDVDIILYL